MTLPLSIVAHPDIASSFHDVLKDLHAADKDWRRTPFAALGECRSASRLKAIIVFSASLVHMQHAP